MRTSDEKRREVAENLRYLTIGHSIKYKEQFFDELADVVVGCDDCHHFDVVIDKLADLIDRPTCHVVKHETYYGSFGCEEAGELWTLSCGDECINDSDFPPSFCPVCGAVVIEKEENNG